MSSQRIAPSAPQREDRRHALRLSVTVWVLACFFMAFPNLLTGHAPPRLVLVANILCSTVGALLSFGVALAIQYSRAWRLHDRVLLAGFLTLACVGAMTLEDVALLPRTVGLVLPGHGFDVAPHLRGQLVNAGFYVWVFGFYATVLLLDDTNRTLGERGRRLAEADAAAKTAQLAALRFQLNPHFIFNTLNALAALVGSGRNVEAGRLIERLADFLRSTLTSHWAEEIRLEAEMSALAAYLEIERVRFQDRLDFEFDTPDDLARALVPNLILQPLAENAVRYGVAAVMTPVRLRISAVQQEGCLVLAIEDDVGGPTDPLETLSRNAGLETVGKRVRTLYGELGRVEGRFTSAGYRAEVTLPLILR